MILDPKKSDELAARIPDTTTLLDAMPQIAAPVATIWSGNDHCGNADTATESERPMRQFHPNLKFQILDAVGHWLPYEDPVRFERALPAML
ncbi:MAG: alpha/beta hydrolase [Proteobacteria bacterium]|nr:alpha/beta hydrolase [Pseudomonadota bacterium]